MKKTGIFCSLLIFSFLLLAQTAQAQVGRGKFGFGLSAAGNYMQSDWPTVDPGYGLSARASYALGENWGLLASFGADMFSGKALGNQKIHSTTFYSDLSVYYQFLPTNVLNPFVFGGMGLVHYTPRTSTGFWPLAAKAPWDGYYMGGLGVDYWFNESWSVIATAEVANMLGDGLDGMVGGVGKDQFGRVTFGIRYYLFDRSTVQRIVDSVKK